MDCIYFFDDNGCFTYLPECPGNIGGCKMIRLSSLPDSLPCSGASMAAMIIMHSSLSEKMRRFGELPLITIGTSDRATLSCSSLGKERIMVSLQRSVKSFGGKVYEPAEYMLYPKLGETPSDAMAALAVSLLTDTVGDSGLYIM